MPTISGNVGAVFNGGTITQPLGIAWDDSGGGFAGLIFSPLSFGPELAYVGTQTNGGVQHMQANLGSSDVGAVILDAYAASAGADNIQAVAQTGQVGGIMSLYAPDGTRVLQVTADKKVGFFGTAAAAKPTATGAKLPSDTVMASLLTALVALGLITDSTT